MNGADRGRLDPQSLEVLDREECRDLIAAAQVGRVAFCRGDGVPTVLPVNHVVDTWTVAFRTTFGAKLSAALLERPVAFEVDHHDPSQRSGWSVLVRGVAHHATDPAVVARLEAMEVDVWADGVERPRWVCIPMDELSGRRIPEADDPRVRRRGPG
jgi:uncharacterized protein